MNKKKICFIAQFPPPMHGLSKAVETLYHSNLNDAYCLEKVDLTNNKNILKNLKLIAKSKADLFYFTISQTCGGNLRDLMILKLLEKQNKRCLIHLHGGYYRTLVDQDMPQWQKKANYKAMRKVAGAIVLGPSLKYIFQGMVPEERIYTVANCVDDQYLMSDEEFEQKVATLNAREVKHVLYLSNFIREKGYPEVLEMAKLERARCEAGGTRKWHFDFAGKFFEQTEEDLFFQYIEENKLENYVTYHGVVGGEKKMELLKKCDVFALLTRYPKEGQPISILEAMGNGMLIVTTDHAGIPDIVGEGMNALIVRRDNQIMGLFEKLTAFEDYQSVALNNRNEVMEKYREDIYISNMGCVFSQNS